MRITLICAGGMSTSILVGKMREAAKARGVEAEIRATAEGKFEKEYADKTDILLLGPQVGFMVDEIKKKYRSRGIKVDVIESIDYGMMDGAKVLNKAIELYNNQI